MRVFGFYANFLAIPDKLMKRATLWSPSIYGITAIASFSKFKPWPEKVIIFTLYGFYPSPIFFVIISSKVFNIFSL